MARRDGSGLAVTNVSPAVGSLHKNLTKGK